MLGRTLEGQSGLLSTFLLPSLLLHYIIILLLLPSSLVAHLNWPCETHQSRIVARTPSGLREPVIVNHILRMGNKVGAKPTIKVASISQTPNGLDEETQHISQEIELQDHNQPSENAHIFRNYDAKDIRGKIISCNFSVFMAGMNGKFLPQP
jgi:hypothetical protein